MSSIQSTPTTLTADIFKYTQSDLLYTGNESSAIPNNKSSEWYESALNDVKNRLAQLPKLSYYDNQINHNNTNSNNIYTTPLPKPYTEPTTYTAHSSHTNNKPSVPNSSSSRTNTSRHSLQSSQSTKQINKHKSTATPNKSSSTITSNELIQQTQYNTIINNLNHKIQSLELRLEGRQNALVALEKQLSDTKHKLHESIQQQSSQSTQVHNPLSNKHGKTKFVKLRPSISSVKPNKPIDNKHKQQVDELKQQIKSLQSKSNRLHEINTTLLQQYNQSKLHEKTEHKDMKLIEQKINELSSVASTYQQKNIDLKSQYNDTVIQLKSASEQLQLAIERINELELQCNKYDIQLKSMKHKHKSAVDQLTNNHQQYKQCIDILYHKLLAVLHTTELEFNGVTLYSLLPHELHGVVDSIKSNNVNKSDTVVKLNRPSTAKTTKHVSWTTPR